MKKSRTITIETVENGWIVRPFDAGDWSRGGAVRDPIYVFIDIHELQLALPSLIERPPDAPR